MEEKDPQNDRTTNYIYELIFPEVFARLTKTTVPTASENETATYSSPADQIDWRNILPVVGVIMCIALIIFLIYKFNVKVRQWVTNISSEQVNYITLVLN